jgi:ankyrin repeat protein
MKKLYLLVSLIVISVSQAENVNFDAMNSAEEKFNQRQAKDLVIYMPLARLFDDYQVRSLAEAAGQGDIEMVVKLVEQGVDVNSQGTKGVTPLFWSLRNISGFEKLLQLGANPNIIFDDSSVMHWAARNKDTSFLKKTLLYGGNTELKAGMLQQTPIFKTIGTIGSDNQDAMSILLDAGANINAVTGEQEIFGVPVGGKTPVMFAADLARFDIVYILLKKGADFSLKDDSGRDLMGRILSMKERFTPQSPQAQDIKKVIEFIESKNEQ